MLLRDGRMLIVLFSTVAPSAKERRSLKAIRVKIAEAIRSRPSTLLGDTRRLRTRASVGFPVKDTV
jgi:hypothetical protein